MPDDSTNRVTGPDGGKVKRPANAGDIGLESVLERASEVPVKRSGLDRNPNPDAYDAATWISDIRQGHQPLQRAEPA